MPPRRQRKRDQDLATGEKVQTNACDKPLKRVKRGADKATAKKAQTNACVKRVKAGKHGRGIVQSSTNEEFRAAMAVLDNSREELELNLTEAVSLETQIRNVEESLIEKRKQLQTVRKKACRAEKRQQEATDFLTQLHPRMVWGLYQSQDLSISVLRTLGPEKRRMAAQVCKSFSEMVMFGQEKGMFRVKAVGAACGSDHSIVFTADGECFTFGSGGKHPIFLDCACDGSA